MIPICIISKFANQPRGKRLVKWLAATSVGEPPESASLCLVSGQDYQGWTPAEQRKWLTWGARPGCAMLLLPPYQTGVRHEPDGWEIERLDSPPRLDHAAHPVLRLTQPEISHSISRGVSPTRNAAIDGGTRTLLNGLSRKHPDSGIFAVTVLPIWSLALADHVPALTEWLSVWISLAGRPADAAHPVPSSSFEPSQLHYSILLYLASDRFPSRAAAIEALAWNDIFEISGADVSALLDDLEAAGLTTDGTLTDEGRRALLESPYRHYAEACFSFK